jgi:hypothetical protein
VAIAAEAAQWYGSRLQWKATFQSSKSRTALPASSSRRFDSPIPKGDVPDGTAKKQGVGMKIGIVSVPFSGPLNPMTALARRVKSRGNEVVFFGVPDVEPFARAAGLDFAPSAEAEYPTGSIERVYSSVATMRGFEVKWCGIHV